MDVIYLLGVDRNVRAPILSGVAECIHAEADGLLNAAIPASYKAEPGEFLGFYGVDGRFLLFEIDDAEDDETEGVTTITATDAAIGELKATIVHNASAEGASPETAALAVLKDTEWTVSGSTQSCLTTDVSMQLGEAWPELTRIRDACGARLEPRYEFNGSRITGRTLYVSDRESRFCGRIIQNGSDAAGMSVTRSKAPRPMVYGLGATGEDGKQLTFADVEWSVKNGDPVDKPKGQAWVAVPQAAEKYPGRGKIYEESNCEDAQQLLRLAWREAQRSASAQMNVSAVISDLELSAGMTWKSIRLYDLMAAATGRGEIVEKAIIAIDRNYVRPWETRVTLGEEGEPVPDIRRDVASIKASAVRTTRRAGGAGAKAQANYKLIEAHDVRIENNHVLIGNVKVELNAANATIALKADHSDLEETNARVSSAELILNGKEGEAGLIARVDDAEASITVNSEAITLRATTTYVDSEITKVKTLIADKIEAAISDINLSISETIVTNYITVKEKATVKALAINGTNGSWKEQKVVTGVSTRTRNVMGPTGTITVEITEVSSVSTSTLKYFGHS